MKGLKEPHILLSGEPQVLKKVSGPPCSLLRFGLGHFSWWYQQSSSYPYLESPGLHDTPTQRMPGSQSQLVSSNSGHCFKAKLHCHVRRKPFPTSTSDRSNHSFKDPLEQLSAFVLSFTIW